MSRPLQLLIFSDGKPGHRNQSLGLAEALARLTPTQTRTIELGDFPYGKKISHSASIIRNGPRPDWIIATGHGTHACALLMSRKFHCRSIVLMKPSWPRFLFDACLIPAHDLINKSIGPNVIPTSGALNRIVATSQKQPIGTILIGGESRDFGCDPEALRVAISDITRSSALNWHITDSRRSPEGFLTSLSHLPAILHPHQQTAPDWLPQQLGVSETVWVTCESVSMIYEALSSGARVGLLPMPARQASSKIQSAIEQLHSEGRITPFAEFLSRGIMKSSTPLAEADRCAKILLEKFPLPL